MKGNILLRHNCSTFFLFHRELGQMANYTDYTGPYINDIDMYQYFNLSFEANMTSWYYYPPALKILSFIGEYISPSIYSVGIFLNLFAAFILRETEFKKVTPFVYLLSLCIIDTVYLIAKLIPNKLYNIYVVPGVCQIVYYLSFLSIFMEWWIVVMLMFERVISLHSSRIAGKYCNPFRVKCAIITMALLSIVAHLYHTWTSVVHNDGVERKCIIIPEFYQYLALLRKLDVIFAFIIPFSLISIMLLVISIQLCRRKRRCKTDVRQFITTTTTVAKRPVSLCIEDRGRARRTPDGLALRIILSKRRITIKLLIIVVLKIVLCVPHDVLKTKLTLFNPSTATETERVVLLFLDEIYFLNFSIKGFLCFALFPSFRRSTSNYLLTKLRYCCQRLFTRDHSDV